MVGGADAAGGFPSAEVGADPTAGGPAEAAGRHPGGPDLGAPEPVFGDRLFQSHGGENGPLRFLTVDIGGLSHHVRLAVFTLGGHLIVALIEVSAVGVLNVVGHIIQIPFLLYHGHGQVGDRGGQGQHFADLELIDVVAGVQRQQLCGGHVVLGGDLRPGIALFHLVSDLGRLGAVKQLRNIAQVHDLTGGNVLLPDLNILCKFTGNGIFIGGRLLQLVQQFLQRALVGGGADAYIVDVQAVGGGYKTDLIGKLVLVYGLILNVLTEHPAGIVLQQGIIDGVGLSQCPGGDAFQILPDGFGFRFGSQPSQHLPVIGDGGADGEEGAEQDDACQRTASSQEHQGVEALFLFKPDGESAGAEVPLSAAAQQDLPQPAGSGGQQPPEHQQELQRLPVGLREPMGLSLPDNPAAAAAKPADLLSGPEAELAPEVFGLSGSAPLSAGSGRFLGLFRLCGPVRQIIRLFGVLTHNAPIVSRADAL